MTIDPKTVRHASTATLKTSSVTTSATALRAAVDAHVLAASAARTVLGLYAALLQMAITVCHEKHRNASVRKAGKASTVTRVRRMMLVVQCYRMIYKMKRSATMVA